MSMRARPKRTDSSLKKSSAIRGRWVRITFGGETLRMEGRSPSGTVGTRRPASCRRPPARRGWSPDQAMEGDAPPYPPDPAALRAGGFHVPQTPATGAAALGLRQPKDLMLEMRQGAVVMITRKNKGVGRRSSAAVATSREGHRSLRSALAVQHRRWGGNAAARLHCHW
jgi:hypothetical protein